MASNDRSAEAWLDHAERMQRAANHEGAIAALKRVLAEEPDSSEAHALLAISLLATRRVHAAAREAREALALEPEGRAALMAFVAVATAQRRWDEARAAVEALLALAPGDVGSLRLAAELRRFDDPRAAERLLERARELDPDDPDTLCALGRLLLARREVAEAGALARAALGLEPEDVDAHVLAGEVALAQGDARGAWEHARAALGHAPSDEGALRLLTSCKARESALLGLWWRFANLIGAAGSRRALLLSLGFFVAVQLVAIVADHYRWDLVSEVVMRLWLVFCVYTWAAPVLFRRMVERELKKLELRRDF